MSYTYEYPRPAVSADSMLFRKNEQGKYEVLLIKRMNEPYKNKWALPGGFVEINEKVYTTALRELEEETGIRGLSLEMFGIYDDIDRDPRGRTITVVFTGFPDEKHCRMENAGSDASAVCWFPLTQLPDLAFDHARILRDAICKFKLAG